MKLYLICNNMLSGNVCFDLSMDIEKKKKLRPLSINGAKKASEIKVNVNAVYSSLYSSSIETAKYISERNNVDMYLDKNLNDCKIGDLQKQSLKMLSFFQEKDFDYKLDGGESLNECGKRIEKVINKIKDNEENSAICLPRRALFSYIAMHSTHGFNLEERIVLTNEDDILMESSEDSVEIFSVEFSGNNVLIEKVSVN